MLESNSILDDEASHPDILRYSLYSRDAEQAILTSILNNGDLFQYAAGCLDAQHFYQTPHRVIFQAMAELFAEQCPIDLVSVVTHLQENGLQEQTGGTSYVYDLAISGASCHIKLGGEYTFRYYAKKIIDLAKRRETVRTADVIAEIACDRQQKDYAEAAQALLMNLEEAFQTNERSDAGQSIQEALQLLQDEHDTPNGLTGLSTGLPSLDVKTHGFQPHQLITISARPGGGKSALALNIAAHVAIEKQKPVLYISLEMTSAELMKRLIKAMAGTGSDITRLVRAANNLQQHQHNLLIEDEAGLTLAAIQSRIMKAKKTHPSLALIVVDHIGLIAPEQTAKKNQTRAYEIQEITSRLKTLAKTVQVPIVQLAQMNRLVETRQNKKPMLSDLRDSGSIEMDSDIVLFTDIEQDEQRRPTGNATLTIAKQRDGMIGEIPLIFVPHLIQFKEKLYP